MPIGAAGRGKASGKVKRQAELIELRRQARSAGQTLVFTNGCFDVLHAGHVGLIRFAKEQGDILVVAVNSDASVRRNKGAGRPVFPLERRLEVLAALADVDYLVAFGAQTPLRLIARLRPDVLVKGADWNPDRVVGRGLVEAAGGRVMLFPVIKGLSTSQIIGGVRTNRRKGRARRRTKP
jgi:D-beta-D-heptose 7-phosphate kinase/D-beta-D-heptose 1-phosphate adenosyltransferase